MSTPPSPYTTSIHGSHTIHYRTYLSESDLSHINTLVSPSLSEPYSVYTYRYFLLKWPRSCVFAFSSPSSSSPPPSPGLEASDGYECVGCCICKVDVTEAGSCDADCDDVTGVTLEVEEGNKAMHVYRNMGFVEVGRWKGYYLNGSGARRFKLKVQ
ncbi:hypothetical protein TrRE_jg7391 [Triparma retinervis]|uniref:N-acetyltransferase domain-containing protein n=1 Tax=Triparma retinervis TaxID=2557542 RepID=A0A9W6ZK84_9STRA|nr:hypothetical protein TrRE_jg7391 [Triparma retinervis]